MKITDIIRGILDLVDTQQQLEPAVIPPGTTLSVGDVEEPCGACGISPCGCETEQEPDLIAVIQQLAGVSAEPEYANEPQEITAELGASFPSGDDMHHSKNPADIRTNAPSMYPGFQAGAK